MATKRGRVTVNLLPSDEDWLRQHAEDHGVTLSVALQTLIGTARVRADQDEEREHRKAARLAKALASRVPANQLDLFHYQGVMH